MTNEEYEEKKRKFIEKQMKEAREEVIDQSRNEDLDWGVELYRTRKYRQAVNVFHRILQSAKEIQDQVSMIYALLALGDCYFYLKSINEAMSYFERARTLAEQIKDKNTLALSQSNIGKCLILKQGYITQARYLLIEAIQLFDELNDDLGLLHAYNISGVLEVSQGNREEAKGYFERGSILAQSIGKKQFQDYFKQRLEEEGEEMPFPYIYYFPYPKGPPAASAEAIPKRINCPSCQETVMVGTRTCPFCGYQFVEQYQK